MVTGEAITAIAMSEAACYCTAATATSTSTGSGATGGCSGSTAERPRS